MHLRSLSFYVPIFFLSLSLLYLLVLHAPAILLYLACADLHALPLVLLLPSCACASLVFSCVGRMLPCVPLVLFLCFPVPAVMRLYFPCVQTVTWLCFAYALLCFPAPSPTCPYFPVFPCTGRHVSCCPLSPVPSSASLHQASRVHASFVLLLCFPCAPLRRGRGCMFFLLCPA